MAEEQDITIKIKPVTGDMFTVTSFSRSGTVKELKEEICKTYDATADALRLIYKGQILKDPSTVDSYGIGHEHVIHLVKSKAAPASGSGGSSSSPATGITAEQLSQVNRSRQDPLITRFQQMGMSEEAAEQQASKMREMMNTPQFQEMFSNPQIIRGMLETDPMFKRMAQESPELGELLNNPEELQRLARIMANPNLSREFIRGIDLQINQAEAAGFAPQLSSASSSVNRMMENIADSAAEEQDRRRREATQAAQNNPFSALFGAPSGDNDAVLPWGAATAGGAAAAAGAAPGADPLADLFGGAGAGGGGFPDLSSLGGLPDLGSLMGGGNAAANLSSPAARQMRQSMTQMLQDPAQREAYRNSMRMFMPMIINSQPQLKQSLQMMGMGDIETNPATMERFLDLLTNPNLLQFGDRLEEMYQGQGGGAANPFLGLNPAAGQAGGAGGDADMLRQMREAMAMLGMNEGGLGGAAVAPPPPADPETAYASQLQQLNDMGFWDREANIRVLISTQGNVNAAVERLLSSPP